MEEKVENLKKVSYPEVGEPERMIEAKEMTMPDFKNDPTFKQKIKELRDK